MGETVYFQGQKVEVTDEAFKDSWYTALVIGNTDEMEGSNKKKKILIEYEKLMAGNGGLNPFQDAVDVDRVRPQPPQDEPTQGFQMDQFVDAYYANGWWQGKIFGLLDNHQYKVLMSSPTLDHQEIEFGGDKLRLHREFVDGKWVLPQSQDLDTIGYQADELGQCSSLIACSEGTEPSKDDNGKGEVSSKSQLMKDKCQILNDDFSTPSEMSADHPSSCDNSGENHNALGLGISPLSSQGQHCDLSRSQSHLDFQVLEEDQSSLRSNDNMEDKNSLERRATNTLKRVQDHSTEMVSESSTTGIHDNNASTTQSSVIKNEVQKPFMSLARCSMSVGRGKTIDDQQKEEHHEEVILENGVRLFVKSHSMWKDLDLKMQSFPSMPQQPHFQPLQQLPEPHREGNALGHVFNFLNLVEMTSNAQITQPKRDFKSKIDAINSLGVFGFNIEPIRGRVEELLSLKESRMQLDERLEQFEGTMKDVKLEEKSVNREIDEIEEILRGLEESLAKVNKECKMDEIAQQIKSSSIATCERRLEDIEEKIEMVRREYSDVATAPW